MTSKEKTNSIQKTARTTGFLYMLLIPLGVFGMIYFPTAFFVPDDIAATISNIRANESLFRLTIMTVMLTQVTQIFVVLSLYKVLKPAGKNLAMLMVIFVLLAVPMAMLNELNQIAVLLLLNGAGYSAFFTTDQIQALVALFIDLRYAGINIAGIFWGLWLFPMGYLVFKSGFLPKIIGVFLIIACFGYMADSIIFFLVPDFGITFAEFLFIGELMIIFWLLIKGVNVEEWEKRALESA